MSDMVQDDLEKVRSVSSGGIDTSIPALIELTLGVATAFVALGWLAALLWVPDPVDGLTWMSVGATLMSLFGIPAALVYGLRRGGAEMARAIVREYTR